MQTELKGHIIKTELDFDAGRLKFTLKNSVIIYIRYNNYQQYSYVIQFSLKQDDRVRFDNFDARWNVSSSPHHCHPRFRRDGVESIFSGHPRSDLPVLCKMIKNKEIFKIK
ncbi:MAG: toxin-antitoxin system TumE family protein [Candidatus Helarchaeota archaeon]